MPNYVVEHQGKKYRVEAATAEEAASAFDVEASGPSPPANEFASLTDTMMQSQKNAPAAIASGVPEGARRLRAGGAQLFGAVQDYFGRYDKAGRGKQDLATSQELLRASMAKAEADDAGVDMGQREGAAMATQLGTLAFAPEAALPRTTTIVGGALKNLMSGGAGAALEFSPDQTKGKDTAIGGIGSAALGLVPSLPAGVKNMVGRGLRQASLEGRTASRVANMKGALPNVKLSLAQRTGVPELQTLERANYNSEQVNFFADQTDQFIADATNAIRQPLKEGQTLSKDFAVLKEGMDDHISGIRKNASGAYEYGMSKAALMSKANPTPLKGVKIPVTMLKDQFSIVNDQAGRVLSSGGKELIPPAWLKEMESILQKDHITPKELADTLKGLTALQKDDNKITAALASRLREGLDQDLDMLAQAGPMQTDDVTKMILDTRAEYRRAMQAANELSEAAAYKMMDGASGSNDLIAKFSSFDKSKQESVRDFLKKHSPDMLRSMKQSVMEKAVADAGVIREAADSQKSLEDFQKALFSGDNLKTAGLWDAKDLAKMESIKDGLRVIQNNRPLMGGAGTPIKPEDLTTNLVSRSSIFLTRQLTRVLNNGRTASRFFLDENVYQQMTKLNRSTTGSAANLAARAALLELLQEEYPAEEQQ